MKRRADSCGPRPVSAIRGAGRAERSSSIPGGRPPGGEKATRWSWAARAETEPRPAAHLSGCLGSGAGRGRSSQSAKSLRLPPRPPALSPGGALASCGPEAHGHTHPLPAAPRAGSPALPTETPFTAGRPRAALGARGRGWGPRQAAENEGRGRRAPPQTEARWCPVIRRTRSPPRLRGELGILLPATWTLP